MTGAPEAVPTQLVAGKYQLTRLLGRGGMGSVWEGVHTSLGTRVAVKFIEAEYADSREARSRFENEARAAATLRSKHVVQVFDHGVTDDARPYIVMEYLAGEPLDRRLDRVGRLSPADTAKTIGQVCRALAKAHEAGIVHRDLKPENVFLVWDEEDGADIVKVVDFGIAKFSNSAVGLSSATRTGSVLGTPYYMSPEQARGLRSVDYRSDLWSVGVIAYRCLVGQLPFDGEAIGDLLVKLCTAPLPVPSQHAQVPIGFDEWFSRALQREPAARFSSALELSDTLNKVCGVAPRGRLASSADSAMAAAQAGGGPRLTPQQTTPMAATPMPPMQSVAGVTAGPVTQTPSPIRRSNKGGLIAGVVGGLLVLGIGAAILIKFATGSAETPQADVPSATTASPAAPAPPPAPSPEPGALAPKVEAVVPAPAPVASADVAPAEKKPVPSKAVAKPAVKVPKPEPKAEAPKPEPPKPKPAQPQRPAQIDVGY